MPTYDYECPACKAAFERHLPLDRYDEPQACECGSTAKKVISSVGFILKGDSWPSKNIRVSGQMATKNKRLTVKQNERQREQPAVTLAPNVNGERVGTWSDAQKLAASKGLNAQSYTPNVRKEQAKR
jgi:putative FmdB family regulatory protein